MDRGLRILYWNAAGLKPRIQLLRHTLREQNVDVALINESHLRPSDAANFPGYHILRLDAPQSNAFRGLLVAVRRNLVHQPLPILDSRTFQSLGVEVTLGDRALRIFAIYRPSTSKLDVKEVRDILSSTIPTLLAGDWNIKHPTWGNRQACTNGRKLFVDASRHNYEITGPDEPTHYPMSRTYAPTTIDLVVHRGMMAMALEVLPDAFGSDHLPVLAVITGRPVIVRRPPARNMICWEKFAATLNKTTPVRSELLDSPASIDRLEANLTNVIKEAMDGAAAPLHPRRLPKTAAKVLQLITEKRRVRAEWQRTREPATKTKLNNLIESVRAALDNSAALSWDARIAQASEDQTSLFKLCRQITKKPAPVGPLYHDDGSLRYMADDRAEIFADHLRGHFAPNPSRCPEIHSQLEWEVENILNATTLPLPPTPFFSPSAVRKAAGRLKPRKAPGRDGVTNGALRHLPLKTYASLSRLFNAILRLGYFPQAWKEGLVIMFVKQYKNPRKADSYRPITLLSATSKLLEKLLLPLLQAQFQPRTEQFGFRSGHSTTLQATRVLHQITNTVNRKEGAAAVFLDVAGAFDRVWHLGLLHKMIQADLPLYLLKFTAAFLQGRSYRVRVESAISSSHPISAGVPQGSVLSPIFYSIYTDDIPLKDGTTLALYADDIALISASLTVAHAAYKLQEALELLPEWLAKWRLNLNVSKTQAIHFGHLRRAPPSLTIGNEAVEWKKQVTYLGIVIDRQLKMLPQVVKATSAARVALHMLRPLFRSRLPLKTRLLLYKMYVRSRLTYAAPAWYALTNPRLRSKLQTVQNIALRLVAQAPYCVRNATLHRDLCVESLEDHIRRLATQAFHRADTSSHFHIINIAPLHSRPPDVSRPTPRDLILPS